MEIVFIIGLLVLGGVVYYFNKDKGLDVNNDGKVDVEDIKEAVDNAKAGVKAEVKKLPSLAKLKAQTKAQLEELGREFGVELDKRKNKDTMIADLKKGIKAQKK